MSWGLDVIGLTSTMDLFAQVRAAWNDEADAVYIAAPTVNYAVYQERGTSDIDARPFMRPAADRVNANPEAMIERYGSAAPTAGPVETLAIAVQNEAKKIADEKEIRDTGALINSISYAEV
jgi:TRAP-type uncharacterized transport system substrate-binding protein